MPAWQSHVIVRDWKNLAKDAVGPYPITCLAAEADLGSGLEYLREAGLVSVTLVVDGLLGLSIHHLEEAFSLVRPFKTHYLVDPASGVYEPSKHHRHEIRRALRNGVEVRVVRLSDIIDDWTALYEALVSRHRVGGLQRFSRESFLALNRCEGLAAVAAFVGQELVSCHLWFQYRSFAWSHLAASSELGYSTGAAYAVFDQSIRNFAGHVINLGGAAGIRDSDDDGLARFKAGFANRTQVSHLVGSVLDPMAYRGLCAGCANQDGDAYFPAYRAPSAECPQDATSVTTTSR